MMKVSDFIATLRKMANSKTLYVMGGWGYPLNSSNKDRTQKNKWNQSADRRKLIYAASADTFAFDCCGIVKSAIWGWSGNVNDRNGGAVYASNGLPDHDAKQLMFEDCKDPSSNMSKIDPGEFLWYNGHCGVYLGDGKTIESTPSWKDGVQIRDFDRRWTHHGHLKVVDYSGIQPQPTPSGYQAGSIYPVICEGPLRIRTGASTSTTILENVYKGDKILCDGVTKDSAGNTWLKISGYVCAKYGGEVYIDDRRIL